MAHYKEFPPEFKCDDEYRSGGRSTTPLRVALWLLVRACGVANLWRTQIRNVSQERSRLFVDCCAWHLSAQWFVIQCFHCIIISFSKCWLRYYKLWIICIRTYEHLDAELRRYHVNHTLRSHQPNSLINNLSQTFLAACVAGVVSQQHHIKSNYAATPRGRFWTFHHDHTTHTRTYTQMRLLCCAHGYVKQHSLCACAEPLVRVGCKTIHTPAVRMVVMFNELIKQLICKFML